MNGNMNKANFFLSVSYLYNKKTTWLLGDIEFLFKCSTQYLMSEILSSQTHLLFMRLSANEGKSILSRA